jgi:hypothetical protein
MHRWASTALGLLLALSVAVIVVETRPARRPGAAPSASAPQPSTDPPVGSASAGPAAASAEPEAASPGEPGFDRLPDGRPVPALPPKAPKEVGFGVVLVGYRGAQLAPKDARSKQEAHRRALELLELARRDFRDAVKKGDRGSTEDAGRIPRGVLESALEYILFTLPEGQVYDEPLDTPRGYWIVKRTD